MICHEPENIVIDIAEKMNLGLYSPVELRVFQGWMLVEETAVPTAHLVVGFHAAVLDIILFEDLRGFLKYFFINPGRYFPVLFWNQLYANMLVFAMDHTLTSLPYHIYIPPSSLPVFVV